MEIIENPYNLTKRSLIKNIIKILIVAAITLAAVRVISANLNQTSNRIRENQILLYGVEHRAENQTKLEEQYKIVFPYLDKIKTALPSQDDIIGFIDTVETEAKSNGIKMTLSLQESGGGAKSKTIIPGTSFLDLQIKIIEGNVEKIDNFISSLDKIIYFTNLNSLELTSQQKDLNQDSGGTIKGQVFIREEETIK